MIGAVLVASVTTVGVGAFGVNRMSELSAKADLVYADGTVPVDALRTLQVDWWELQTHIARANIEALPPESRAQAQEKAVAEQQAAGQAQVMAAMQPLIAQMNDLEVTIVDSATAATSAATKAAEVAAGEARDAYEAARTLTLVAMTVAVVLSLAIGLLVARTVRRPVRHMRDVLGQVAAGDLTVRAGTVGGGAELGEMARSLDTTLDALGNVLGLVNASTGRLAEASTQLDTAARWRR